MKQKPCDQYKEKIEQYACDELTGEEAILLQEHIEQCEGCRGYCQALESQDDDIRHWVRSLEPSIAEGQAETLQQFRQMPQQSMHGSGGRRGWIRYAAAAGILIVFGFLAGRAFKPSVDLDQLQKQWAAAVQPQMEKQITASVVQSLRPGIIGEYTKLQESLSGQISAELKAYAEQTVVRNDVQTYRLLAELIYAIEKAQTKDRQWALSAIGELEKQRLMDQQQVRNELAALAIYTKHGIEGLATQDN